MKTPRCSRCGKFTAEGDFFETAKSEDYICISCWTKETGNKWNQDKMRYEDKDGNPL